MLRLHESCISRLYKPFLSLSQEPVISACSLQPQGMYICRARHYENLCVCMCKLISDTKKQPHWASRPEQA